ncbi:ABC transporter substrate-binding protein [Allostreptomyces psammosilenae]|uniref:Polar amino acid transport system substrate-binding protein n=1 Tax=Allostreptomyces psammosilenae TaxID=1892865 RepID=A0A852ZVC4_9ACTN|nr:ABC transporter substrate-binding protein [Allostreptomyces psammosilenae]NYI06326.1 polar amino acid transport system substrate-binding protein [Allostreptomyces psammosilenae]
MRTLSSLPARRRLLAPVALVAAGTLLLSACGSDDGGSGEGGGGANAEAPLFDQLPAEVQESGVLRVGTNAAYAPMEYVEGDDIVGVDPDLGAALGEQLGVEFEFTNAPFDSLLTSLSSGRLDVVMSAMSDTAERQETVDFVDYFNSGTSILVAAGNPEGIQTLDDLCGKTIALQKATTMEEIAEAQKERCATEGLGELTVNTYENDTDALLQVRQGRAVADLNDFPVAAYNAQNSEGAYEVVGEMTDAGPFGIAVPKEDTQLRDAIAAALDAIIADGSYAEVLEKWNVSAGAVEAAEINGGS